MDIVDFQASTARWGQDTFGKPDPGQIARRMNVEMAELLISLDVLADLPGRGIERAEAVQHAGEECADVLIMLVQVAAALDVDLGAMAESKMLTNRSRTWGRTPSGMIQHVEGTSGSTDFLKDPDRRYAAVFKEEGSGLMMELDKWYVLSDSGSAYTPQGFATAGDASSWCHSSAGLKAGAESAVVPIYNRKRHAWTGQGGVNILLGADLQDFWAANPLETQS